MKEEIILDYSERNILYKHNVYIIIQIEINKSNFIPNSASTIIYNKKSEFNFLKLKLPTVYRYTLLHF
jgi:hypothetical protein